VRYLRKVDSKFALTELQTLIARHCRSAITETAVPGLTLHHATARSTPAFVVYQPRLCVIAQGQKRVVLGDRVFDYDPAKYLVASVDLPVSGCVIRATPKEPYLAVSIALDLKLLATILLETPPVNDGVETVPGLAVNPVTPDLLDPIVRLVRLIERPRDVKALAPLIEREIHYCLLRDERSGVLRQMLERGSRGSQVNRAITHIRSHYAEPLSVQELAGRARMSSASLHRHFKAVTSLSPVQYQKRVRLQEARSLLLASGLDAGTVALRVGYESVSQFTREYGRLFGAPPRRDAVKLRSNLSLGASLV